MGKKRAQQALPAKAFIGFLSLFLIIGTLLTVKNVLNGASLQLASIIVLTVGLIAALVLVGTFREKVWSLPFLFLLIFFLFHGGLYFHPALYGEPSPYLDEVGGHWFVEDIAVRSAYLLCLAMLTFALGSILASLASRRAVDRHKPPVTNEKRYLLSRSIGIIGSFTVILSVGYWLVSTMLASGPLFFLGSYRNFLNTTAEANLSYAYLGIALGVSMLAQHLNGVSARMGVAAFAIFALLGLPIGLRNEVLIPFAIGVVIYARTRKIPKLRYFAFGMAIMLSVIAAIRQLRQEGLADFSLNDTSASPFTAVEEMGYSIRVLFTSVQWHEVWNEPFASGLTYVTPFFRLVDRILGLPRTPAEHDFGLMNTEIADRVGQIGGSFVAEAHHNFGPTGVALVLFATGFLLSTLQLRKVTPLAAAYLGLIGVLALMHVRNSFTPLLVWGIIGAALIGAAWILYLVLETHADNKKIRQTGRSGDKIATPSAAKRVPLR